MSKAGDTIENPITGERVVVRVGTEDSGGDLLAAESYVLPGGTAVGEHVHPAIEETFEVVSGRVGFRIDGRESVARPGERLHVPAGTAHDWWNAGDGEARVVVEVRPGERFEEMALNLVGLAQDGQTDAKGMPNLLQAAIFAREFGDVLYFTRPPSRRPAAAVRRPGDGSPGPGLQGQLPQVHRLLAAGSFGRRRGGPAVWDEGGVGGVRGGGPPLAGVLVVVRKPRLAPVPRPIGPMHLSAWKGRSQRPVCKVPNSSVRCGLNDDRGNGRGPGRTPLLPGPAGLGARATVVRQSGEARGAG